MSKCTLVMLVGAALLFSAPAFAVDGQVLINQSTVMAAGGFPYKITQPGSYKLSGNLVVSAPSTDGIVMETGNVTLDLNGFTISGPVTCTGYGSGLSCSGTGGIGIYAPAPGNAPVNQTIRNGSVVGFQYGVQVDSNGLVEEIHATGNSNSGIYAIDSLLRRNIISYNVFGIQEYRSTVTENVASWNLASGLVVTGGVYGGNTFEGNGDTSVRPGFLGGGVSQNNNDCNGTVC
jgi:hypothetical protein